MRNLGFTLFVDHLLQKFNDDTLIIYEGLEEFREHIGGELTVMLLEEIGKGTEVHTMNRELIHQSIEILKRESLL